MCLCRGERHKVTINDNEDLMCDSCLDDFIRHRFKQEADNEHNHTFG